LKCVLIVGGKYHQRVGKKKMVYGVKNPIEWSWVVPKLTHQLIHCAKKYHRRKVMEKRLLGEEIPKL